MTLADLKRLRPVLLHLACRHDVSVQDACTKFGVPSTDVWFWLKQFNGSRPHPSTSLVDRMIEEAEVKAKDTVLPRATTAQATAAIVRREIPAPKPAAVPAPLRPISKPKIALNGPTGDPLAWLREQGADKPKPITNFIAYVTPDMAARWLTLNTGNRKPSWAKVRRFAGIIAEDKWYENGEVLKFSVSGRLLDGQSRLRAIIEAQKGAWIEIRFNLPDAAQQTMDCGEARRATHTLEMMGCENPMVLSPALRLVYKVERFGRLGGGGNVGKMSTMENLALPALVKRHTKLGDSVKWAMENAAGIRRLMPLSEAAFFHYAFAGVSTTARDEFFAGLIPEKYARIGGPRRMDSSPVSLLRNRLTETIRVNGGLRLKLIVKAWNAHADRKVLPQLAVAGKEGVAVIRGTESLKTAA